jgi:hypothetical protein
MAGAFDVALDAPQYNGGLTTVSHSHCGLRFAQTIQIAYTQRTRRLFVLFWAIFFCVGLFLCFWCCQLSSTLALADGTITASFTSHFLIILPLYAVFSLIALLLPYYTLRFLICLHLYAVFSLTARSLSTSDLLAFVTCFMRCPSLTQVNDLFPPC